MREMKMSKEGSAIREKGFSILELLVSLVIFLIITSTIYGLLEIGRVNRNRSSRRSDILKNARIAVHLIGRDALNAGHGYHRRGAVSPDGFLSSTFGLNPDTDSDRDMITSIIVGDNIFENDLALDPTTRTDTVVFASRDLNFNRPAPAAGIVPTGEVIELRDVDSPGGSPTTARVYSTTATGAAAAAVNDLYLIESGTSQVAIMATAVSGTNSISAQPGDPLGLNQPMNGVGSNGSVLRKCLPPVGDPPVNDENCTLYIASLKRFSLVSYRVTQDGTLMRTVFGNGGPLATNQRVEQPLAYNVENLQITYVLDDGRVVSDPYLGLDGLPASGDEDPAAVNQIRQITISIRVQSTEIDEQTLTPESITLNATFSTRNMEYDAS
jgi:prepilin-type N-terminal cleavage/methylation domain